MAGRDLADHTSDTGAIQRQQSNQTVVRTQTSWRPELRTGRGQQEQRRLRAAFGQRAYQVERWRVGPV